MNRLVVSFLLSIIVLSCNKNSPVFITIINNDTIQRIDNPVVITRAMLDSIAGTSCDCELPVIKMTDGTDIPSQCDDLTKDGKWDELAFVVTLKPLEKLILQIDWVSKKKYPVYNFRTNICFARIDSGNYVELNMGQRIKGTDTKVTSKVFQMEGPAWENDKVAFRNYFDERNGMDIFGKITDKMVLDSVVGKKGDYHTLQWWGMDILKVANSLGAGSIALKVHDSLYRIGPNCIGSWEIITEGPVRSIHRFTYKNWQIDSNLYAVNHIISIWAGSYAYDNSVVVEGCKDKEQLVAGIVNLHSSAACFSNDDEKIISLATFDNQAFGGEKLGMAILMKKDNDIYLDSISRSAANINATYYLATPLRDNVPVDYSFYACWEKTDTAFTDKNFFLNFCKLEVYKKTHPLSVLLNKNK